MKIALLGLRMYPPTGSGFSGIDTRCEEIINYLARKNNVHVFVRRWATQKINYSIPDNIHLWRIYTLKNKYLDTLIYSLISSIYVVFLNCDLVLIEGSSSGLASILIKIYGKRIILTVHAIESERDKWGFFAKSFLKTIEKIAVKLADRVIVVSLQLKKYLAKNYNINPTVILHPQPNNNKNKNISALKNLNLEKNKYILFLGRFVPEKRVHWLIEAYKSLRPEYKLVLAGGPSFSDQYTKVLKKMASDNKKIIFPGYVIGELKQSLIAHCHLFVLPSSVEGLPIALIEAMGYNRAVLIANLPQYKELVNNKRYLFKTKDYYNFKEKLTNLINSPTESPIYPKLNSLPTQKHFFQAYEKIIKFDN